MPLGAFGGKSDVMALFDPRLPSSIVHPGTFNINPLALRLGYIGLTEIYTPDVAEHHNMFGDNLRSRLNAMTRQTCMWFSGLGSLMNVHFCDKQAGTIRESLDNDSDVLKELLYFHLLEAGIYISKRETILKARLQASSRSHIQPQHRCKTISVQFFDEYFPMFKKSLHRRRLIRTESTRPRLNLPSTNTMQTGRLIYTISADGRTSRSPLSSLGPPRCCSICSIPLVDQFSTNLAPRQEHYSFGWTQRTRFLHHPVCEAHHTTALKTEDLPHLSYYPQPLPILTASNARLHSHQ